MTRKESRFRRCLQHAECVCFSNVIAYVRLKTACVRTLLALLPWILPVAVQAQFSFTTNAGAITITGYSGPGGAVTIPATTNGLPVTSIGAGAFAGNMFHPNYGPTSLTIPASVTNIGLGAFNFCYSLTAITVDAQNSFYSSTNGVLFDLTQATLIQYPGGLGGSYIIPGSVTSIGDYAFYYCYGLTNVTIPDSVVSIGSYAFDGCTGLSTVTIPSSVTIIGEDAFCFCAILTNLTISNGVTNIGVEAFQECTMLTTLTIPGSVTSMGDYAFNDCFGLTNVTIANGITSLGDYAFYFCYGLTSLTIPGSVTNIGEGAFFYCTNLTSLTIPGSVISIGEISFQYCTSLTNVTIANGVTGIGSLAFEGCSRLTSVTIGNNVSNLAYDSFSDCTKLTSLYFTGNGPAADSSVFSFDNNAKAYYLPGTSGWGAFSANSGVPIVLWNPGISSGDASFGVQNNQFGFNITNVANLMVVVEVCTNLVNPVWVPLTTNTLVNGSLYFSESFQANTPGRFYGLGFP